MKSLNSVLKFFSILTAIISVILLVGWIMRVLYAADSIITLEFLINDGLGVYALPILIITVIIFVINLTNLILIFTNCNNILVLIFGILSIGIGNFILGFLLIGKYYSKFNKKETENAQTIEN